MSDLTPEAFGRIDADVERITNEFSRRLRAHLIQVSRSDSELYPVTVRNLSREVSDLTDQVLAASPLNQVKGVFVSQAFVDFFESKGLGTLLETFTPDLILLLDAFVCLQKVYPDGVNAPKICAKYAVLRKANNGSFTKHHDFRMALSRLRKKLQGTSLSIQHDSSIYSKYLLVHSAFAGETEG